MVLPVGRRGTGPRLRPALGPDRGVLRRPPARRQPVLQLTRGAQRQDGRAGLALSDGPPRRLGMGHGRSGDPRRDHGRREADRRRHAALEDRLPLRLRSPYRGAGMADRGEGRARLTGPRGTTVADPAISDEAAALRPAGIRGGRPDRLHAGAPGAGPGARQALPSRADVHAARPDGRRAGEDRHPDESGMVGNGELAHRRLRSRDRRLLRRVPHLAERVLPETAGRRRRDARLRGRLRHSRCTDPRRTPDREAALWPDHRDRHASRRAPVDGGQRRRASRPSPARGPRRAAPRSRRAAGAAGDEDTAVHR